MTITKRDVKRIEGQQGFAQQAAETVPEGVEDVHYLVTRVLQKRLERIPGVGRVDIWGVDEAVVWIDFDREALISHGVDLVGLMDRLGSDNFQLASGQVTDRLLVVARPIRDEAGRVRLDPPEGGYLLTNLALPDAMRLLGGRRRRLAAGGVIGLGIAIALLVIGGIGGG